MVEKTKRDVVQRLMSGNSSSAKAHKVFVLFYSPRVCGLCLFDP